MHKYIQIHARHTGVRCKWCCMYLQVFDCIRMHQCCMISKMHICMYIRIFVCMCMYPVHVSTHAYQNSTCICAYIHVSVCIMYVSCMYVFFCMYLECILLECVCIASIGPNQHSYSYNLTKWPVSGPATRRPYSGQPWAGAHLFYSAIHDTTPDPIWRTTARSTRRGGPTRVQDVANRPPMCINTLVIPT